MLSLKLRTNAGVNGVQHPARCSLRFLVSLEASFRERWTSKHYVLKRERDTVGKWVGNVQGRIDSEDGSPKKRGEMERPSRYSEFQSGLGCAAITFPISPITWLKKMLSLLFPDSFGSSQAKTIYPEKRIACQFVFIFSHRYSIYLRLNCINWSVEFYPFLGYRCYLEILQTVSGTN